MIVKKISLSRLLVAIFLVSVSDKIYALNIEHGPYLQELSDTGVTIMWATDKPATASVEYQGSKDGVNKIVEETFNGVLKVSKLHAVRISGLNGGESYTYRVKSTEVTNFSAQNPILGTNVLSSEFSFTTNSKYKNSVSFLCVTDVHRDPDDLKNSLNKVDWKEMNFLALTGDIIDDFSAKDSGRIYSVVVDPCTEKFASESPFVYIRGNHEYRGSLGPHIYKYFPRTNNEWFYSFYQGPAYFFVFDTGEDKKDASEVFGGYTKAESYLKKQQEWFKTFTQENEKILSDFPVKIALVHDPDWGYGVNNDNIANDAEIDLIIGGHTHSYAHDYPGNGRSFHRLVIGRYMSAKITVKGTEDETTVLVTVYNQNGGIHDSFEIVKGGMVNKGMQLNNPLNRNFEGVLKINNGIVKIPTYLKGQKKSVKVYSINGRLIKELITEKQIVRLSDLGSSSSFAKGITLVKIETIK